MLHRRCELARERGELFIRSRHFKESSLRDYSRRGIVPSIKIGRHVRFVEADLVGYLDGLRGSFDARLDTGFGRRKW